MNNPKSKDLVRAGRILSLSLPLIVLLILVSIVGLLYPQVYRDTTPNWLAQSLGQDTVDLFLIVPVLIVGTLYSSRDRLAMYLWVGTLLYIVYTFLIYCFTVRFNALFLPYCFILGVSFFSITWFFSSDRRPYYGSTGNTLLSFIGIFFVAIAILFYSLWLTEIITAAFKNEIPLTILNAGLLTNPVHVIDLSIFLPGTFVIGVMAVRRRPFATIFAPVLLVFFFLMDLTIATLSVMMKLRGVGGDYMVAIVMITLAAISLGLLVGFIRRENEISD